MIKNKKVKKNWSGEDVQLLTWVVSKYADYKGVNSIERDLVFIVLCRMLRIGIILLH